VPVAGIAGAIGVLATALPVVRFDAEPDVVGLVVGWSLAVDGGIVLRAGRAPRAGWLLLAASVAWFLPDLARFFPPPLLGFVARTSLLHLALVGVAVVVTRRQAVDDVGPMRVGIGDAIAVVTASTLLAAGLSGWTGGWRVTVPLASVTVLLLALGAPSKSALPSSLGWWRSAGVIVGFDGLVGLALRALQGARSTEAALLLVHELAVVVTGGCVAVSATRTPPSEVVDLRVDEVDDLARAVGRGVRDPGAVALWVEPDGWLDVAGRPVPVDERTWSVVHGIDGGRVAALGPTGSPRRINERVRRLLLLAAEHAGLRAGLRRSVVDLERSRRRLLDAQDAARSEVRRILAAGPLVELDRVVELLERVHGAAGAADRAREARAQLREMLDGLEPLARFGSLREAVTALVESCPATVELELVGDLDVDHARARAVWFSISEGITNALKHAPGSVIAVSVEQTDDGITACVRDRGPGSIDPRGSGLTGLADRAAALGGRLEVVGTPGVGTTLELRL
jgi:signal transduction histidine kinase